MTKYYKSGHVIKIGGQDIFTIPIPKSGFYKPVIDQASSSNAPLFSSADGSTKVSADWYDDWKNPYEDRKKCECGVEKTYGQNAPSEYHSDWCPLFKVEKPKGENNEN